MPGTHDDDYFEWLYGVVLSVRNRNPARSYWQLARQLYTTEFVWSVPNDDNRVEDGKGLRDEYMRERGIDEQDVDQAWLTLGCSMLEMLIALARQVSFEDLDERGADEWFGIFLTNLDLLSFTDKAYNSQVSRKVEVVLDDFINRRYEPSGRGGIFPLQHARKDQRTVELWYQMSAYLLES